MFDYLILDTGDIGYIADWSEIYVACMHDELSKSKLSSSIQNSSGSEVAEDFVDSIWQELERREILYGKNPPFCVQNQLIEQRIDWKSFPEYMACLIFALEGNPTDTTKSGKLFEKISSQSIRGYLNGQSMIYGHPKKQPIIDIANVMNEKYMYDPPKERNDRGLDIIAWKPFDDNRASQIILLVQCAAGKNYKKKFGDICLEAWCKYIHFACTPQKAFSYPGIIRDSEILNEYSYDAGVFFDRARLYRYSIQISAPDKKFQDELIDWCQKRLNQMLSN